MKFPYTLNFTATFSGEDCILDLEPNDSLSRA